MSGRPGLWRLQGSLPLVGRKGKSAENNEGSAALAGEEAELAQEVHLVEEQVLGLERVALGGVDRRPPKLNGSSSRRCGTQQG